MKKIFGITILMLLLFTVNSFADETKISVDNFSENKIVVNANSDSKILVKGYTVTGGNNIIIYYIEDDLGKFSDSISIDLNTIARPYKIRLVNSNSNPFTEPFVDTQYHEFKDYIRHLYDLGYVDGYKDDNTFRPNNNITRAEMFTLMVRMPGFDKRVQKGNQKNVVFEDLNSTHWAYQDVMKAVDAGLLDGYDENGKKLLKLNNNITIAEASKLIHEYFNIESQNNLNYDIRFVNHWSKNYIQDLLNNKLLAPNDNLYKEGNLDRPITRGEIAVLISRAIGM